MAYPTLRAYASFGYGPTVALASISWTEITSYLLEFGVTRGRQDELREFEAGSGYLLLDNSGRAFDPVNAAGPFYGYLVPMIRIKITADATVVGVMYVERWPLNWELGGWSSSIQVGLVDALAGMNIAPFWTGRPAEYAGARILAILAAASHPVGDNITATGYWNIEALAAPSSYYTALAKMKEAAASAGGRVYADRRGYIVFEDHLTRSTQSRSITVQATFGDASGEVPYADVTLELDLQRVVNYLTYTNGGATTILDDATSKSQYWVRPGSLAYNCASGSDATNLATLHLALYKDPFLRFDSLTPVPDVDTHIAMLAALEVSDLVDVWRRPNSGTPINAPSFVERIAHTVSPGRTWKTKLRLSPAHLAAFFTLDSTTLGVLDQNRLAI